MNKGLIIDFKSVAAYLAHEKDSVQAEFFNTFAKELDSVCGTFHHADMQMTWAARHLTPRAKEHLKTLSYEPDSEA